MPGRAVSEAMERYLEAIYILSNTGGAIAARVADRLGVRAPSVTQALHRMEAAGWLRPGEGRPLELTPEGTALAVQIMRRHRVLERWLVDGLGLSWSRAHSEAQRMEHAVSAEVVDRLYQAMDRPTACPHGNPIPGPDGLPPYAGEATLDQIEAPASLLIARIAEDAEEDSASLVRCDEVGLRPGRPVRLLARTAGGLLLQVGDGAPTELARELAAKVWVDPVAAPG